MRNGEGYKRKTNEDGLAHVLYLQGRPSGGPRGDAGSVIRGGRGEILERMSDGHQ
jgi:hypothetical protein